MASPSPLQYGQYYHIYVRGNNRENLFYEERNHRHFLRLHALYVEPVVDTYAYCLLRNHFHLLVRRNSTLRERFHEGARGPCTPSQRATKCRCISRALAA